MTVFLLLLLSPLMLVTAFFSLELTIGLFPLHREDSTRSRVSAVVIVPAHNEARVIEGTLRQLDGALGEGMRVLVIADNCSDDTAARAASCGVEVLERLDSLNRGKGFALAFAVEHLEHAHPDVVVVIDADCEIDAQSLRALVNSAAKLRRPSQAINLLKPDPAAPAMVQISAFAFMIKNLVRQRGLQRLADRVHLTGTGMALPFEILSTTSLATGDIVEDLSLGLSLARAGFPATLVPEALVMSSAADAEGTLIQRRRWEGGYLQTAVRQVPLMATDGLTRGDLRYLIASLDLMVPPLALLTLANVAALAVTAALAAFLKVSWTAFLVQLVLALLSGLSVAVAWLALGREFVRLSTLARLPMYLAWKLPLYISLARRGAPRDWLRSRR